MSYTMQKQRPMATPTKPAAAPLQDSPGTWRHPRMAEITRRQNAATFSDKNMRTIAWNALFIVAVVASDALAAHYAPFKLPGVLRLIRTWVYRFIIAYFLYNIAVACLPLVKPKDDFSDIPLTPGQRQLLGLGPASAPPTPGSVYSTPPRYSRTPSLSGSTGSKRNFSDSHSTAAYRSPLDFNGSLGTSGGLSTMSPAGSPLIQKAMNGARRSSIGSLGSPNSLGKSFGASTSTSIFGAGPDSPSISPANGKKSSIALSNKWLYERGRRSSGNAWS